MRTLAFDTCFSACSVAVSGGLAGGIVSERRVLETGHAEALMPMIERVMTEAGMAFGDLDRIVVTHGPGTFTGVRTGIAAAKALALATRAEVVAVSSLWVIARAPLEVVSSPEVTSLLCVMDARKGEVYAQTFDRAGEPSCEPTLLTATDAAQLAVGGSTLLVGNAAREVFAAATTLGIETALIFSSADATQPQAFPDARYMLTMTKRPVVPGHGDVKPLYLRAPDAKPQSGKSLAWTMPWSNP